MVDSLAIMSPWTSGRLERSARDSDASLKPPNTQADTTASSSPPSPPEHPLSVSIKVILTPFYPQGVSLLQRLTLACVVRNYEPLS